MQTAINATRVRASHTEPSTFVDADGTVAAMTAACNAGMDIACDRTR